MEVAGFVNVEVRADLKPFSQGLNEGRRRSERFDREVSGSFTRASRSADRLGRSAVGAANTAAVANSRFAGSINVVGAAYRQAAFAAANFAGAALGAFVGGRGLSEFANFEQGLRNVAAVAGSTADEFLRLDNAALRAAASTRFDPSQTTQALYALASSGQAATQQIATLPNVLNLAEAGQADLGRSTELVTSTLSQFGLQAQESARLVDVFVAAIGASALNVPRLQVALRSAGPTAAAFSQSLEGTVSAIGLLTTAFGNGERAGTGFRALLAELPDKAAELGITVKSAQGEFLPFIDILRQIEASGASATSLVETFGAEAGPALAALLKTGSDGLANMESRLQSNGQAARVAGEQLDTLKGDFDGLRSAVSVAFVEIGRAESSVARSGIQTVTNLIRLWSGYGDTLGAARRETESLANAIEVALVAGALVVLSRTLSGVTQASVAYGAQLLADIRLIRQTALEEQALAAARLRNAEAALVAARNNAALGASYAAISREALAARTNMVVANAAVAATSTRAVAASLAMRGLQGALALVGGPVGAGILALAGGFLLVRNNLNAAREAAEAYALAQETVNRALGESVQPTRDSATALLEKSKADMQAAASALQHTEAILARLRAQRLETSPDDIMFEFDPFTESINELSSLVREQRTNLDSLGRTAQALAIQNAQEVEAITEKAYSSISQILNFGKQAVDSAGESVKAAGASAASAGTALTSTLREVQATAAELRNQELAHQLQVRKQIRDTTTEMNAAQAALNSLSSVRVEDVLGNPQDMQRATQQFETARTAIERLFEAYRTGNAGTVQEFLSSVEMIREGLKAVAAEGNAVDPFIDGLIRAFSASEQLRASLERLRQAQSNTRAGATGTRTVDPDTGVGVSRFGGGGSTDGGGDRFGVQRSLDDLSGSVNRMATDVTGAIGQSSGVVRDGFGDLGHSNRQGLGAISDRLAGTLTMESPSLSQALESLNGSFARIENIFYESGANLGLGGSFISGKERGTGSGSGGSQTYSISKYDPFAWTELLKRAADETSQPSSSTSSSTTLSQPIQVNVTVANPQFIGTRLSPQSRQEIEQAAAQGAEQGIKRAAGRGG